MKKIIIHSIPVAVSWAWLYANYATLNPIDIKGPVFLKFYIILLLTSYVSVFILKSDKETVSKISLSFLILIFALGAVKLIRGIISEKPVGFLLMILFVEAIIASVIMSHDVKDKIK
ncbi:hypothetical protein EGY07_20730 [Chryseobacterium indologenes]|uniref:hypothetical protein n=1 Tax=Chryseobacterium indologenes TaxID=253 RepID=UPI000B51A99D|nr:hypothetical protein [Chryseobacterium indologenes]ASE63303.1 hypothetical protein CEQ15_18310 [Chryseobacterium indologenes]ATN07210.1 hypothetical protein CRN76_18250 [Chryseobacterium indologenes]AYY84040.1 hypothetical protein EGX91_05525 [Chryseobacterium indologenes]AYZ37786.1 hypothetical protein EGY07_20730 [Chryseobacterium indologenes]MBF6646697.1 hypothetical protein [Chryseobacterium indologenes]